MTTIQTIKKALTQRIFWGFTLGLSCGVATPGLSAEQITFRVPLQTGGIAFDHEVSVTLAHLEHFAKTGEMPLDIRSYVSQYLAQQNITVEQVQKQLNRPIQVNPDGELSNSD